MPHIVWSRSGAVVLGIILVRESDPAALSDVTQEPVFGCAPSGDSSTAAVGLWFAGLGLYIGLRAGVELALGQEERFAKNPRRWWTIYSGVATLCVLAICASDDLGLALNIFGSLCTEYVLRVLDATLPKRRPVPSSTWVPLRVEAFGSALPAAPGRDRVDAKERQCRSDGDDDGSSVPLASVAAPAGGQGQLADSAGEAEAGQGDHDRGDDRPQG